MKTPIALIMGGFSHESQISLKSARNVYSLLDPTRFEIIPVLINEEGWFHITNMDQMTRSEVNRGDFSVALNGQKVKPEAACIMIHGTPGEDGILQGYFDLLGIPYTTCGQLASALTFNKYFCNSVLKQHGITCAKAIRILRTTDANASLIGKELGYPLFVKPGDGGSSFGVSKVKSEQEILPAIEKALEHGTEALLESFIEGTEVTCGIYKLNGEITVLPPTEIVPKGEFFDFDAKYKGDSDEITPAGISGDLTQKVQDLTRKAYETLNLKGIARIDFIIKEDLPYLIEVNTVPGMSDASIIPQQMRAAGIDPAKVFNDLISSLLE